MTDYPGYIGPGMTDEQKEATMRDLPAAGPPSSPGKVVFEKLLAAPDVDEAVRITSTANLNLARGYATSLTKQDSKAADVTFAIMDGLRSRSRGGRRSRLNVKRRGTKRHGRGGKHRKLRKLTTRRR